MAPRGMRDAKPRAGSIGRGRGSGSQQSGIEKYGQDEVDEFLDLDAGDDEASAAESNDEPEDIMEIDADEDEPEDYAPPKRSKKAKGATEEKDSDEEVNLDPSSKGWRRTEFYGGEDAGDDSDVDSDEDLIFAEAKRLDELRAQQLTGEEDVLAALLAPAAGTEEPAPAKASKNDKLGAAASSVHFESVFAGEAETVGTTQDRAELPASERRKLLKKEAPELLPLLNDFKVKLASLRELLPLLRPAVLKRLPTSGAAYLEAKVALLLNTLANLSFYLLLRAEGGAVKAHPVVPQLVWLRELHEQLAPLDGKLGKKMRKALSAAGCVPDALSEPSLKVEQSSMAPQSSNGHRRMEAPTAPKKKTLQQRLARLQLSMPAAGAAADSVAKQASQQSLLTKDLLKLPKAKRAAPTGSASAPADLDDIDPSLGVWAPKSSLGEQLSMVQQQLKEHATRAKIANESADVNPEAKPRKARKERGERHPEEEEAPANEDTEAPLEDGGADDDEPDLIKSARRIAALKKEKRNISEVARADQKEDARRLRQFHPEGEAKDDEKRLANKKILNNRGLARVRKKKAGNARVMNREKYTKAIKRRKGAVQDMRQGEGDGATYDGEATGIRTHVKKSMKIG